MDSNFISVLLFYCICICSIYILAPLRAVISNRPRTYVGSETDPLYIQHAALNDKYIPSHYLAEAVLLFTCSHWYLISIGRR